MSTKTKPEKAKSNPPDINRVASNVETAKGIRAVLKAAFPTVRFSVTCERERLTKWITVSWEGGPSKPEVRTLLQGFKTESGTSPYLHRVAPAEP